MIRSALRRFQDLASARERVSGEPPSANGASSFHLAWDLPPRPLTMVEATLEILEPPGVNRLYFWALQVGFARERRMHGAAHLGLQWNTRHPGNTAVNWGGYAETGSYRLMQGGASDLPSARNDANTRDFSWSSGHRYRLRVASAGRAPDGSFAWQGSVTDLETATTTVVRDLYSEGDSLVAPMVWSEVFARCEHPRVTVRWSGMTATTADGLQLSPGSVRVNYQARADGGCDNTTVALDELGVLQSTASQRQVPQGAVLPLAG